MKLKKMFSKQLYLFGTYDILKTLNIMNKGFLLEWFNQ